MHREILRLKVRTWLVGLALVGVIGSIGAASMYGKAGKTDDKAAVKGSSYAADLSSAFRTTAERVLPAVVMIKNTPALVQERPGVHRPSAERKGERPLDPFGDMENSPFGDLFRSHPELRRFFNEMPSMPRERPQGMGSGVIIDASGVILTNNHVVEGGGKIAVRLHDGREYEATEVKTDPRTDLAIVRIKADNLTAASLGDSDQTQVGDWVLALGQPFGLEGTVTAGIISAKGRGLGITARESFLQTDAAINPGNSGGPLVNLDGEVVGINTAISSRSGGYQGVGFAVPVSLAKWVARQLVDTGSVRRAYLGVGIQPVGQDLAKQFGVKVHEGVVVTDVFPNTPGAKAGLKAGDVVLSFDGKAVSEPRELQTVVEQAKIGAKHPMVVVRDGKQMTLEVVAAQQPADFGLVRTGSPSSTEPAKPEASRSDKLGLEVETLTAEVAKQLGVQAREGVAITEVRSGSLADRAGLEAGMVVAQVDRKPVKSAEEFGAALKQASIQKGVLLLVRSPQGSRFVVLRAAG